MEKPITYVGLDVYKETLAVALAEAGMRGEVREFGTIANTPTALKALTSKLARSGAALRFCYEGFKLFSVAAAGQGRKHDHETTVDHALMRGLITAGPVMRRGASSV